MLHCRYRISSAFKLGTASETVKTRLALSGLDTAAAGSPALASTERVQLDRYSVEDLLHLAEYNEGKVMIASAHRPPSDPGIANTDVVDSLQDAGPDSQHDALPLEARGPC